MQFFRSRYIEHQASPAVARWQNYLFIHNSTVIETPGGKQEILLLYGYVKNSIVLETMCIYQEIFLTEVLIVLRSVISG